MNKTTITMEPSPTSPLAVVIRRLRRSPLFQLSLASKELFHSNFLAWLCENYPEPMGRVFASYLKSPPAGFQPLEVCRELKNIDLWLKFPDGQELIIENKVKSLATLAQLEEYAAGVKNKTKIAFLLLSLTRPPFLSTHKETEAESVTTGDGAAWHFLSYGELANRLRHNVLAEVASSAPYHEVLLEDYVEFATQLDLLQSHFVRGSDESRDFYGIQKEVQELRLIRMHDVIDKLRYAQLAARIATRLEFDGFEVVHRKLPDGGPGRISIAAGMTRGVGMFDLKYVLMNIGRKKEPVMLGVQVQGRHFRLVVEMPKGSRKARSVAEALLRPTAGSRIWFDFGLLTNASELDEYPQNGDFNQYSGIFFYRSKKLASIGTQELVNTIVAYARRIRGNEAALRSQVESVL